MHKTKKTGKSKVNHKLVIQTNITNLKTNGTNRKFIIFLKLMALTESL